jgi:hypothetical protein
VDARHNGQDATSIPFTQLSTMLIHRHAHMSFPGHNHPGHRHGTHDPMTFNSIVEAIVEEALDARADISGAPLHPAES